MGEGGGAQRERNGAELLEEDTCWLLEKTWCTTTLRFLDIYFFRP